MFLVEFIYFQKHIFFIYFGPVGRDKIKLNNDGLRLIDLHKKERTLVRD